MIISFFIDIEITIGFLFNVSLYYYGLRTVRNIFRHTYKLLQLILRPVWKGQPKITANFSEDTRTRIGVKTDTVRDSHIYE